MKKLLSLFCAFTIIVNSSYASFPVIDTLKLKQNTLQSEEINLYHSNLIKMGIDLNDCKCTSCRISNTILQNNTIKQSNVTGHYILSGLILLGVIIWISVSLTSLYNCADSGSDCSQSSGEKPKNGAPSEFLWMSLLILISVGVAAKARFIKLRDKRDILKNNS